MKTVLIVAESKVVRSMVARGLSAFACRLLETANGREGVQAAREHKPDMVLLDATPAVMTARQMVAELRKGATTQDIPVILLTDEEIDRDGAEFADLGAAGHVAKPFQMATLEHEVSKVLGQPSGAAATPGAPTVRRGGRR